jgi:hypothetical protein
MSKYTPVIDREHPVAAEGSGEGTQQVYRFPNGYGASVVRFTLMGHAGSYGSEYGKYELGVIAFESPESERYHLVYDTGLTEDVVGHLDGQEVEDFLTKIEALPIANNAFERATKRIEESRASLKKFAEEINKQRETR